MELPRRSFRCPPQLWEKMKKVAKEEERSISSIIIELFRKLVNEKSN